MTSPAGITPATLPLATIFDPAQYGDRAELWINCLSITPGHNRMGPQDVVLAQVMRADLPRHETGTLDNVLIYNGAIVSRLRPYVGVAPVECRLVRVEHRDGFLNQTRPVWTIQPINDTTDQGN